MNFDVFLINYYQRLQLFYFFLLFFLKFNQLKEFCMSYLVIVYELVSKVVQQFFLVSQQPTIVLCSDFLSAFV